MRKFSRILVAVIMVMFININAFAATQTIIQTGEVKSINQNSTKVADGQLSATVFGNTLTNMTSYDSNTWAEWTTNPTYVTTDEIGAEITFGRTGDNYNLSLRSSYGFKAATKYGILYNVVSSSLSSGEFLDVDTNISSSLYQLSKTVGNNKGIFTTRPTIAEASNYFRFYYYVGATPSGNKIKIKDIRVFELPSGSQIESDFNSLTADQLSSKYPSVKGTKSSLNTDIRILEMGNLVKNGNCESGISSWKPSDAISLTLMIEDCRLKLVTTSPNKYVYQKVSVKANTNYYLSGNVSDATDIEVYNGSITTCVKTGVGVLNTGSNTEIAILLRNISTGTGYADSIMLTEGTAAPAKYESYKDSILSFPTNIIKDNIMTITGSSLKKTNAVDLSTLTWYVSATGVTGTTYYASIPTDGLPNGELYLNGTKLNKLANNAAGSTTNINDWWFATSTNPNRIYVNVPTSAASNITVSRYYLYYQLAKTVSTEDIPWITLTSAQKWTLSSIAGTGYKAIVGMDVINTDSYKIELKKYDGTYCEMAMTGITKSNEFFFSPTNSNGLYWTVNNSDTGFKEEWISATTFMGMTWDGLIGAFMNGWKLITPDNNVANCVWMGIASGATQTGTAGYSYVTSNKDTGFTSNKLFLDYSGVALAGTYNQSSSNYNQETAKKQNDYMEYYKNKKVVVNFNWYHSPTNWTQDYMVETTPGIAYFDENSPAKASSTAIIDGYDDNNTFIGTTTQIVSPDGKSVSFPAITGATQYHVRYQLKTKKVYIIDRLSKDGTGIGIETLSTKNAVATVSGSNITITVTLQNPANSSEPITLYTDTFETLPGTLSQNNRTVVFTATTVDFPSLTSSAYFDTKRWTCKYTKAKTNETYSNIVSDGLEYRTGNNTLYVENTSGTGRPNATVIISSPDAPAAIVQSTLKLDSTYNRAGQVKIKWNTVSGAERYKIYRKEALNDLAMEAGGINDSTGAMQADSTRVRSKDYFRIRRNTGYVLENNMGYTAANIFYYDSSYSLVSMSAVDFNSFTSPNITSIKYAKFEVAGTDTSAAVGLFETGDRAYRNISSTTNNSFVDNVPKVTSYKYKVVPLKGKVEGDMATAPELTVHKAGLAKPSANYPTGTYNKIIFVELKGTYGKTIEYQVNLGTWKDYTGKIKVSATSKITARIKGEPTTQISYAYTIGTYILPTSFSLTSVIWNPSTEGVTITWTPVAGAVKYDIYRSLTASGTYTKLNSTYLTGTTFTDSTVQTGKNRKYYYKVKAYSSTGKNVQSAAISCTVS